MYRAPTQPAASQAPAQARPIVPLQPALNAGPEPDACEPPPWSEADPAARAGAEPRDVTRQVNAARPPIDPDDFAALLRATLLEDARRHGIEV